MVRAARNGDTRTATHPKRSHAKRTSLIVIFMNTTAMRDNFQGHYAVVTMIDGNRHVIDNRRDGNNKALPTIWSDWLKADLNKGKGYEDWFKARLPPSRFFPKRRGKSRS